MIFSVIENFVFFSAIFALMAYCAAALVRLAVRKKWLRVSPFALSRIYAGLILLPPVLASWLVLAALLPETWLGAEVFRAAHVAPAHEWHLLSDLTAPLEPFLALATIAFLVTAIGFAAWKTFRGFSKVGRVVRLLEIEAPAPAPEKIALVEESARRHRFEVGLVISQQPLTFVWGFWRSKLIISSGLLNTLNERELVGVIEHEAAHHARRDNLLKLLLSAASYLSPVFPLTRKLLMRQAEQVELVCDEIATGATGQPLEIASALVKVRRTYPARQPNPVLTSGFLGEEAPSIELRVRRLVKLADRIPTLQQSRKLAGKPFFETFSLAALFAGSLAALLALAPLLIHQTTEALIDFVK